MNRNDLSYKERRKQRRLRNIAAKELRRFKPKRFESSKDYKRLKNIVKELDDGY